MGAGIIPFLPIISGGVSAAGEILGGALGTSSAVQQNRENRAWQEKMRATQYQTTVMDMKRAGLNPMMLASGGALSQGMTPGGVQPQSAFAQSVGAASGKALAAASAAAQLQSIQAGTDLAKANADMIRQTKEIEAAKFTGMSTIAPIKVPALGMASVPSWNTETDVDYNRPGRMQMMELLQRIAGSKSSMALQGTEAQKNEAAAALQRIQARLGELGIPKEKAMAALYQKYGDQIAGAKGLGEVLSVLKLILDMMR